MSDNAHKAIAQDHSIGDILITLLIVLSGITVIFLLGIF